MSYTPDPTDPYEYDSCDTLSGGVSGFGASAVVNPPAEEGLREAVAQAAETIAGLSWRRNPLSDLVRTIDSPEAREALAWAEREDAAVDQIASEVNAENRADLSAEAERDRLRAEVERLRTLLTNTTVHLEQESRLAREQRDALAEAGHALALLALQSERYHGDADYRDAVDVLLERSPQGREAPMSSPFRRYGLNPGGRIFMLDDEQPDSIAHFANLEDHREVLAQRDELAAEVERLRDELRLERNLRGRLA